MDLINQLKKLKEITKSPEVKEICENYLSGNLKLTEKEILNHLNENLDLDEVKDNELKKHLNAINENQMNISKKLADNLMKSWNGISKTPSFNNAGSYIKDNNEEQLNEAEILSELAEVVESDDNIKGFISTQELKNLGVGKTIKNIKELSIGEHPKVKVVCEKYKNLLTNKNIPEYMVVHNFINEMDSFKWDNSINEMLDELKNNTIIFSKEIEVAKVLESIKNTSNSSFYSELTDSLNEWLISSEKSDGLLIKKISKWNFNPIVRNLVNYLNENSNNETMLNIPIYLQKESRVEKIFSPVMIEEGKTYFYIGNSVFESDSNIKKLNKEEISNLSPDFISLINSANKNYVKISENEITIDSGKKRIKIIEEKEDISIYLNNKKLKFNDTVELSKMLDLGTSTYFEANESQVVYDIINLYKNFHNIVELDFAKSIVSNLYEGVSINLMKWNGQIYLQRINDTMLENSIFAVNSIQAANMVKDFMKYDITEGLTEFLDNDQKIKSIMINDREHILSNINIVEEQLNKINDFINSSSYTDSEEIKETKNLLENELDLLKNKWNQVNIEINNFSIEPTEIYTKDNLYLEKFEIGESIKIKDSGDVGKIIASDATTGRYTILLDSGKTMDYNLSEIVDLASALKKSEKNYDESSGSDNEEEEEEIKESKNISGNNLLNIIVKRQKLAKAPGNNIKEPEKVIGKDSFDENAPTTKDKIIFRGKDVTENKYPIGYNLNEKDVNKNNNKSNFAKAPGSNIKNNVMCLSEFIKKNKTSCAPGEKGGMLDYKVDDDMGYNLEENEKKN